MEEWKFLFIRLEQVKVEEAQNVLTSVATDCEDPLSIPLIEEIIDHFLEYRCSDCSIRVTCILDMKNDSGLRNN